MHGAGGAIVAGGGVVAMRLSSIVRLNPRSAPEAGWALSGRLRGAGAA
jgi:hypothetical protein